MITSTFDRLLDRLSGGENLTTDELAALADSHDILSLGVLADVVRRRLHGTEVTFLRVARQSLDGRFEDGTLPAAAREVRVIGDPGTLDAAVRAVQHAKGAAGDRTVSAFSLAHLERLASSAGVPLPRALGQLRMAGLDALAEIPVDTLADPDTALDSVQAAGFERLRLTVDRAPAAERTALFIWAASRQQRTGGIQAISPLPAVVKAHEPTTGYDDVKALAVARLAAPGIASVQVDWQRYGPKLAQVALTFGADDLDGVAASDEAPDGRRRAPLEEVKRNIEAAGFLPVERDGRLQVVA